MKINHFRISFIERYTTNAYAFNTLGILLEQEGLFKQAEQAFAWYENLCRLWSCD